MMGKRCRECGDVRWSIIARVVEQAAEQECPVCGGAMVPERRLPGRGGAFGRDRRDAAPPRAPGGMRRLKLG
jgi:hypothetical protein